ncbi:uncharacterized protein LOC142331938 [Lycorma delicatula]|uniref:uncharacterized protein LOC142331938 n=1 Tax=Lycorma delicatula TaxID=130591 RepID=UPI003F518C64
MTSIGDEGMKELVSVLKNSTIRQLILSCNNIKHEGAKYLAEILKDTQITNLDLSNNDIGSDGARYLANGIKNSQVTILKVDRFMIDDEGHKYLIDSIKDTITFAEKIKSAFKELVSLNSLTREFEFTVPKRNNSTVDVDSYSFLIKSLSDNPNVKAHIFDMMCRGDNHNDNFNITSKINKFVINSSHLLHLLEVFDSYNYVNLVTQFQDMRSYAIVQNLLLHRELYYVDANREILHPYIYKMLNEYNLPLYSEALEPDKKETILSYFKSHSDESFDGVQEIIDLLESL